MGEREIIGVEEGTDPNQQQQQNEPMGKPRLTHFLIQIAGWATRMASDASRTSDVLSQLSQASVDLRQANEALRVAEPDIPLHLNTEVKMIERLKDALEQAEKLRKEGENKSSNGSGTENSGSESSDSSESST